MSVTARRPEGIERSASFPKSRSHVGLGCIPGQPIPSKDSPRIDANLHSINALGPASPGLFRDSPTLGYAVHAITELCLLNVRRTSVNGVEAVAVGRHPINAEAAMKQFLVCVVLLLAIPILLLNPLGREAFLGYYLGIIAMWLTFVCVGAWQRRIREAVRT
jgi:hypothetical protein